MRRAGPLAIAALMCGIKTAAHDYPAAVSVRDECPRVTVSCPGEIVVIGRPIIFYANVGGAYPNVTYTFRWTVSAGTITSGQNTSSITVDTTGLGPEPVEATVEVGGFPEPCDKKASCASQLQYACVFLRKLDEYGALSVGDERARLDNFAVELKNDPEGVGYIVSYAGRRARLNEARTRAARAKKYLTSTHDLVEGRVLIIDGGHREDRTIELWILPKDTTPPTPTPTVDPSEVITIKDGGTKQRAGRQ